MANIPKLRLMLARMEKTASARWRTLQGLTALLGKDVVNEFPRIGALQLAAKQQGIKLPGEGFAKALDSLPRGPAGATISFSRSAEPAQVFRGGNVADLTRGGYSADYLHATPFKGIAQAYGQIKQPRLLGPRSNYVHPNSYDGTVYTPKSLVGVYGTTKNQRYMPDFGFEKNVAQTIGTDRLDPTRGLNYAYRSWQDSMKIKNQIRRHGLTQFYHPRQIPEAFSDFFHNTSNRYETLVKPSQLQSLLLDGQVLPATTKGRELLQTGTMPAGAQLPPEILKSAADLDKEAGIADIANRVLSTLIKSPITPSFVKNTFYPGFPAVREALRATGRVKTVVPSTGVGDIPTFAVRGDNSPAFKALRTQFKTMVPENQTPEGVFDKITTEMSGTPLQRTYSGFVAKNQATADFKHAPWGEIYTPPGAHYLPRTNAIVNFTPNNNKFMRHELTHGLQFQLPNNFNSLHTLITGTKFPIKPESGWTTVRGKVAPNSSNFLLEMNANAAMSRTPLGQIGEAISFATDPWRARAYAPKYTPTEKWVHDTLSFPRDIPRRVKAMPGQLMAWIDSKILPPNLTKGAGVFTASGNKVQGVGLRKLYHSLLDERGLTGLGVNNEDTGDVELSFDGDEARRKEVFKELAARIRAKTNHPVTFAPTTVPQTSTPVKLSNKDSERLNAIHHLAYRMSNMYDPADPLMDPNDTFKQKLADRFRLQVNKRGLTGTVPSRAAEQLLGTRPMYAGMMPARRTRSEAEALSDMPMKQQQRLFKALKSGRGFLAPVVDKLASAAVEAPMNLYSYIPNGSIEHVKKHGLLSGNELAKPENRHLLDIARPDGDADRWLKERDARLAKSPWTNSYNGPSAFFGDIDAEKIHDKHPIKKFNTTRAVIKLRELLRDYPATKMEGSELIPFSDTTYDALDEKGRNEFVNKRHHTLSLDEIKALLTRGQNPKDMWKDFKDTEGKYYASDVPHAQVVTPMGKIPSKYIKFGEADMGKDAVGFTIPDDVLTKHAGIAQLGMAAVKGLYGLGSAAVKSPIAQNIATGASNLVNSAGNLANTAIQSPMAQNIATRAGNLVNSAVQSRVGKTLITGAENLHDKTVDLANRAIQNPIVSRLYAGANKLTDAAIQSPITPNFIKNTFKPGYEAQRQALRRTSREWVQNWDEPTKGFRPMPKKPVVFGPNPSPDRVFRQYKVETTPLIPSNANGVYWPGTDQISARGRGTLEGMRTMRHELAHGLQYKLPSSLPSLQTASVNSPFAGSFLREMNANAASSRTPLGQMGRAIGYATSPERLKAYWNVYKPADKLMHGAAVGTAYGVPLAAATVAGGVGTYNGLHSLASRMQPTNLPHNPEFAQAGPPNPHTEESFPEEVA